MCLYGSDIWKWFVMLRKFYYSKTLVIIILWENENWNLAINSTMCFQIKPNYETYILLSICCLCFGFGLTRVLTSLRMLPEAWELCDCDAMLIWSQSFVLNHGNVSDMLYELFWCIDCYCFPVFSCETEVKCMTFLTKPFLSPRSVIFGFLSSHFDRTKVLLCSLWYHVMTYLSYPFWVFDQYFWDTFQLLVENWWVIVIYLWFFLVTCIGLRWYYMIIWFMIS